MKILFVCTGNICRSPTADGLLRHRLKEAGLEGQVLVDSAGTHNYHEGEAPDPRTVATALGRGVKLDYLRARKVTKQDFSDFDLILAMDRGHLHWLEKLKPSGSKAQLGLFLTHAEHPDSHEVPDPYYGEQSGFDHVFDLVDQGITKLLEQIRRARYA